MAQNKTTENENSVADFIHSVEDPLKQADCFRIAEIFEKQTGFAPKMWGHAIIGFGSYHYKYESGREGDAPLVGFSPRKNEFALYIPAYENREHQLATFGKHKTGKGCIYVKKLADVDITVLQKMIVEGMKHTQAKYG